MNVRGSNKKYKRKSLYSKGELNRLIDNLCHPLFEVDEVFIVLDGFLHALVEQNPSLSIRKFIRHNLPKLIEQVKRKRKAAT